MDYLDYIQNYVVDGQTVKRKLEDQYKGYKLNWLVKDDEVMCWNDIEPLDGSKHYYATTMYMWRFEGDKMVAINTSAMGLTPELAMMRIVKR